MVIQSVRLLMEIMVEQTPKVIRETNPSKSADQKKILTKVNKLSYLPIPGFDGVNCKCVTVTHGSVSHFLEGSDQGKRERCFSTL